MRKLKLKDAPALCRCLKKIGIKNEINKIAKEAKNVGDVWDKGFELIWNIFDLATEKDGEAELYNFLAGPFEMTPDEVADLDADVSIKMFEQLAEENDLKSFFNSALKRTK